MIASAKIIVLITEIKKLETMLNLIKDVRSMVLREKRPLMEYGIKCEGK